MSNPADTLLLDAVAWNERGLVPAIAQDFSSKEVLMMAWMNRESLQLTLTSGDAHYWSRSRKGLWKKGETSGHIQHVKEIRLDCDGDTILLLVEQVGGIACHTGHRRCFFQKREDGAWVSTEGVLTSPGTFKND